MLQVCAGADGAAARGVPGDRDKKTQQRPGRSMLRVRRVLVACTRSPRTLLRAIWLLIVLFAPLAVTAPASRCSTASRRQEWLHYLRRACCTNPPWELALCALSPRSYPDEALKRKDGNAPPWGQVCPGYGHLGQPASLSLQRLRMHQCLGDGWRIAPLPLVGPRRTLFSPLQCLSN